MPITPFDSSIVKQVDPSLSFVRDLYPEATASWTVLVHQDGRPKVLKVRTKTHNMWDERYFHYEISALRRAAERKLEGVTRLSKVYDTEQFQGLLKDYAEGTPGNRIPRDELVYDPEFVARLDYLYLQLHLAGIAKVCFEPRKVVVGEHRELTLVDLSTCLVNTEVSVLQFSHAMREDAQCITQMERVIRRRQHRPGSFLDRLLRRA